MKQLTSIALATILAATASIPAVAQKGQGNPGQQKDRMAAMQQNLDLSDEQMEQIREIRASGGSREDVQAVLTDEQREKANSRSQKSGGSRPDRMEMMKKNLDLTDQQVAEIQQIRANGGTRDDVAAVLTEEQREKMGSAQKSRPQKGQQGHGERQRPPREE